MTQQTATIARIREPAARPRSQNRTVQRLPRIAACVFFHARRRPGTVAVMRGPTPITYGALAQDLSAIIRALEAFNLPPGATAAIAHEDLYIQLLLVFACEALGLVTGSFRPHEGAPCHSLVATADLTLTTNPNLPIQCRSFEVTDSWLAGALANPPTSPPRLVPAHPGDIEVIFRSSGTTGTPKCMALTHAALRVRLRAQRDPAAGLGLTATSRYLAFMHFAVGSTYMAAANMLRLGGTFMFGTDDPATSPAKILRTLRPTHLTLMPFQLRALLASLPQSGQPLLPALTIQSIGARLPRDLRQAALKTLAGRVRDLYGTNEVGSIGRLDESGTLTTASGVQLDIVDDSGRPLPPGQAGAIRIRTPGMVTAYLNDQAATAAMFRTDTSRPDGGTWFHPGDLGIATGPGQFRLVGRQDDLLNLGGKKILSTDLEAKILAAIPLADVAIIQPAPTDESRPTPLIICAVLAPTTHLETLSAQLAPLLDFPFHLHLTPHIPRTPEGKIQRPELHALVRP